MNPRCSPLVVLAFLALPVGGCSRTFESVERAGATPLSASIDHPVVAPRDFARIQALGGVPPYAFAFLAGGRGSGPEAVLASDGSYRAGTLGNVTDQFEVRDAVGGRVVLAVSVGPALAVSPTNTGVTPGGRIELRASGGKAPWRFALRAACDPVDGGHPSRLQPNGEQATYIAGTDCGGVVDRVVVSDSLETVPVEVTVQVAPLLDIGPREALVAPGASLTLSVSGGVPPYRFNYVPHGNLSGGELSAGGVYLAGLTPEVVDEVQAVDSLGAGAVLRIQVDARRIELPSAGSWELHHADLNGDGFGDLLALSRTSQLSLLRSFVGSAAGLQPLQLLALPEGIAGVTVGDLSGDGRSDLFLRRGSDGVLFAPRADLFIAASDGRLQAAGVVAPFEDGGARSEIEGDAAVVETPVGPVLAVPAEVKVSPVVDSTPHAVLLAWRGEGRFTTTLGRSPLREVGLLDLGGPDALVGFGGGGSGFTALRARFNEDAGCSEATPDLLSFHAAFDLLADGGLTATQEHVRCVAGCTRSEVVGGISGVERCREQLGVGEFRAGERVPFLAVTRPLAEGTFTWLPPTSRGFGNARTAPIPFAASLSLTPARTDPAGRLLPATFGLATPGLSSAFGALPDGGFGELPSARALNQSSVVQGRFSSRFVDAEARIDPSGVLRVQEQGIHGQFGERNRTQLLGPLTRSLENGSAPLVRASDLDGDGRTDLLVSGRSLDLMGGGSRQALSTDAHLLAGLPVRASALGHAGQYWTLLAADRTGRAALARVGLQGDGGYDATTWDVSDFGFATDRVSALAERSGSTLLVIGIEQEASDLPPRILRASPDGGLARVPWAGSPVFDYLGVQHRQLPDVDTYLPAEGADGGPVLVRFRVRNRSFAGEPSSVALFALDASGGFPETPTVSQDVLSIQGGLSSASFIRRGRPTGAASERLYFASSPGTALFDGVVVELDPTTLARREFVLPTSARDFGAFEIADLDGDGAIDFVLTPEPGEPAPVVRVGWGRSDGSYDLQEVALPSALAATCRLALPGDFDGDGRGDLALLLDGDQVSVLWGRAGRAFE